MPRLVAGVIGVVLVVLVSYGAYFKAVPFVSGHGYELQAVFSTAGNQLQPNAPVRIAGVEVGKVKAVKHGPGGTALVVMKIKKNGLPLHRDTTAQIRPRLFLEGNYYVSIKPGSPTSPELASKSTVPLSRTAVSVTLGELLTTLNQPTRSSLKTVLREYSGALDQGGAQSFNRALGPAAGAFKGLSWTMEDLRGQDEHDLSNFLRSQAKVSTAFADRRAQLADLVTSFNRTMGALASRRGATADTISAAAHTLDTARPALADVNAALPSLRRFTTDVRPALRKSPATLDAAIPFLDEADRLVQPSALRGLTSDLRPTLRQVTALQPRAGRLAQQVDPVATCLRDVIIPTLKRTVPDGAHTVRQPVWQELRGFSGTTSASQNFDANGNDLRLHVGGGDASIDPLVNFAQSGLSLSDQPIQGSSPRFVQGSVPPFRPDVSCRTAKPADLNGGSRSAASVATSGRTLDVSKVDGLYDKLVAAGKDRQKGEDFLRSVLPPQNKPVGK